MDQIKIGRFIASKRKEIGLTQSELAEKLYITDRAISKWENGNCIPDASNIPDLCKILNITINDLFSGEVVDMKNNEKKLEENLLEMTSQKEKKDKELLTLEILIGCSMIAIIVLCTCIASFSDIPTWSRYALLIFNFIPIIICMYFCIKIEQIAGYYECGKCHHKYVPTYKSVFWSVHTGRTRYMKCPECGKKSWNRKVISK